MSTCKQYWDSFISALKEDKGNAYPTLYKMIIENKRPTTIADELGCTKPAITYKVNMELEQLFSRLGFPVSKLLNCFNKAVFSPKNATVLRFLKIFAKKRKTQNYGFKLTKIRYWDFFNEDVIALYEELLDLLRKNEYSISEIKKIFKELGDKYPKELIGFVIRRRNLGKALPKFNVPSQEVSIALKIKELEHRIKEFQEEVDRLKKALEISMRVCD